MKMMPMWRQSLRAGSSGGGGGGGDGGGGRGGLSLSSFHCARR